MEHPSHARHAFDQELESLEHDLLEMGSRAEQMVAGAVDALCRLDSQLAMDVIVMDDEIDQRDLDIEARCLRILALQQPMARDLRVIGTAIKMITDIERIGDLSVDIAKIALKVEKEFGTSGCIDLPRIASVARNMIRVALEAFVRRDLELVREVARLEDTVDDLYRQLRAQIFDSMRNHPEGVVVDGWLLMAIHHVERIADHAVNIAERVAFMETGELRQITTQPD